MLDGRVGAVGVFPDQLAYLFHALGGDGGGAHHSFFIALESGDEGGVVHPLKGHLAPILYIDGVVEAVAPHLVGDNHHLVAYGMELH